PRRIDPVAQEELLDVADVGGHLGVPARKVIVGHGQPQRPQRQFRAGGALGQPLDGDETFGRAGPQDALSGEPPAERKPCSQEKRGNNDESWGHGHSGKRGRQSGRAAGHTPWTSGPSSRAGPTAALGPSGTFIPVKIKKCGGGKPTGPVKSPEQRFFPNLRLFPCRESGEVTPPGTKGPQDFFPP